MQASSMEDRLKQVADRITFASMNYRIWRIQRRLAIEPSILEFCKGTLVLFQPPWGVFRRHDCHAARPLTRHSLKASA